MLPIADLAAQMRACMAAYTPESMMEVLDDMRRLPDAFRDIAEVLRILGERAHGEMPLHPAAVEHIDNCHRAAGTLAAHVEQIAPAVLTLHQDDIRRHEAPRRNEHMWDVRHP